MLTHKQDVQMPILDGYRATHIIRTQKPFSSSDRYKAIPILAMTASAIQGDKEKCREAGMDDYLAKPVKPAKLEQMLVKWAIKGRKKQQQILKRTTSLPADQYLVQPQQSGLSSEFSLSSDVTPAESGTPYGQDRRMESIDSQSSRLATELGRLAFQSDMALARSSENDNQRQFRQMEQEEKASSLRDDKLLGFGSDIREHQPDLTGEVVAQRGNTGPSHPLTLENIGRFDKLQEQGSPEGDGTVKQSDPSTSSMVNIMDEMSSKTDIRSQMSPPRPSLRAIRQNESERTITGQVRNESKQ